MRYVERLLVGRDFVLLTETHGTEGEGLAARLPDGVVGFWAPGTNRRAGVAILVKQSFLDQFDPRLC